MKHGLNSRTTAVIAGAALMAVTASTGAVAGSLITSKQIKDGTVRTVDLNRNAVTSPKIKNDTIKMRDLKKAVRDQIKTAGPAGPAGPAGARGPQGPAGPAGAGSVTAVKDLNGLFKARAADTAGVRLTGDGVSFGPLNGGGCDVPGADYARLDFSGMNGKALSELKNLVYYARYAATNDTGGVGSPSLRVDFEGDNRLTFSPNTQAPDGDFAEGPFHEWVVTSGSVRLNDDAGSNPGAEAAWNTWMPAHGSKKITNISWLVGCSSGDNLTSLFRWVQVNGQYYTFGS